MKVAFVTEPLKVEIRDVPIPSVGEEDVLIQMAYAGICGSDLHLYKGTHAFRKLPAALGHEISGTVVRVGKKVTQFHIGDHVTVEPQIVCGECEFCRSGRQNLCTRKIVPGTPQWLGTFAEYFVAPERTVYKIVEKVDLKVAALVEPLAVAVQAMNVALNHGVVGDVAILGSGTIGLLLLLLAKRLGFEKVFCTDTADFNTKLAIRLGATAAFDPLKTDVIKEIQTGTAGKGVDICFVAAGAPNIIDQASALTKKCGTVVLVSMITKPIPVYTYSFVFNEQTLVGTMTYTTDAFKKACDLINEGLDPAPIITHVLPMEQAQKGLEILSQKTENAGKVLVCP